MISYGGHDGTRHLSDAHIFDFDTRTWSTLVTEGTPPIPRDSHVSVVHGNSMYCFGGSSGSAMNDLHELQLPSSPSAPAKWYARRYCELSEARMCVIEDICSLIRSFPFFFRSIAKAPSQDIRS